jgi:hypothetical protein
LLDAIEMKLRTVANDTAKQRCVDQPIDLSNPLSSRRMQ